MAEESENSDSGGNILLDNLKKSFQQFGTKVNDQKDNQELKDASNDLDMNTKKDSVPAKKAKQIVKVNTRLLVNLIQGNMLTTNLKYQRFSQLLNMTHGYGNE